MTTFEVISVVAAIVTACAATGAVIFSGIQSQRATESLILSQELERGNVVMHFTDRFLDLVKQGSPESKLSEPEWAYQFWSLHATEFFFFHHGILPTFMYSLWMIDLANFYSGTNGQEIRQSHLQYLNNYSFLYPEMSEFYKQIYEFAGSGGDEKVRNRGVAEFVASWIGTHKRTRLS